MLSGPLAKMAAGTHETKTQPVLLGRYSPRRGRNVSIFTQDPVSEALPVFCFVLFLISIGSYALPSARVRGGTRCRLSSAADQTLPGIPAASRLASPHRGAGPARTPPGCPPARPPALGAPAPAQPHSPRRRARARPRSPPAAPRPTANPRRPSRRSTREGAGGSTGRAQPQGTGSRPQQTWRWQQR